MLLLIHASSSLTTPSLENEKSGVWISNLSYTGTGTIWHGVFPVLSRPSVSSKKIEVFHNMTIEESFFLEKFKVSFETRKRRHSGRGLIIIEKDPSTSWQWQERLMEGQVEAREEEREVPRQEGEREVVSKKSWLVSGTLGHERITHHFGTFTTLLHFCLQRIAVCSK
jgi:hypothetical protein